MAEIVVTAAEARAAELRAAVAWFDEQRISLSAVEDFRRLVLNVADRLELHGTPAAPVALAGTDISAPEGAERVGADAQQAAAAASSPATAAAPGTDLQTAAEEATDRILARHHLRAVS